MLQRPCFVRKRHLERASTICKTLAYRLAFKVGSRRYFSEASSDVATSQSFHSALIHSPSPKTSKPEVPGKLLRVINALVAGEAQEKILESIKQSRDEMSLFEARDDMEKIIVALSKTSTPAYALELLTLAHRTGHPLPHSAYQDVCLHLMETKQWDLTLDLLDICERDRPAKSFFLNLRARVFLETRRYSRLKEILRDPSARPRRPNQQTFHIILNGCLRNHDSAGAKQCLKEMEKAGFSPNAQTQTIIARNHRYDRFPNDARHKSLAVLKQLQPDERLALANNLLRSALETDDLSGVHRLLSLFDNFSVLHLTNSISKPVDVTQDTVLLPNIHPLKPDGNTYVNFMNHLIRQSNSEAAIQLWKKAALDGIMATEGVIVSLVHALFLIGCGNHAIQMISDITGASNAHMFSALLDGRQEAKEALNLQFPSRHLTIRMSNAVLRGLLPLRGLPCIPVLFELMSANNVKPNERTLSIVLQHIKQISKTTPEGLLRLVDQVSHVVNSHQSYMHQVFSSILSWEARHSVAGAWKRPTHKWQPINGSALRVVENFDPTAGLGLHDNIPFSNGVRSMIQTMTEDGVKCDSPTMTLRIVHGAISRRGDHSALDVLKTALDRGSRPSHHQFNALIQGYTMSGDFRSANEVMVAAEQIGVKPNAFMYTTIIAAYARHRDPTSALQTFEAMISAQVNPDVASIDALVSAYYAAGNVFIARRTLIALWRYIEPFPVDLSEATLSKLIRRFRSLHKTKNENQKTD